MAEPSADVTQRLDALFAPWNRTDEPGLIVGIVQDGRVIYRRGFGMASLEHGVANTPVTRMRIGSVSKHFTALLALRLAEDGKLDLDVPIRTYIPELAGPGGDPTVRELLQHRGGSRCYLDLGFIGHGLNLPPPGWPLQTQARQTGRNFSPGEAMIYNNGGYFLVSTAIERVGGAPFEQQLEERLLRVVGMPETQSVPGDYDITPGLATCHLPRPGGRWRRGLFWTEELRGEGAIVSTVDDMLRWAAHLRTRDRFGGPELWSQLVARPRAADGGTGDYALGLMLGRYRGMEIIHHTGSVSGGSAHMLVAPDDGLDVVIMANGARDATPLRLTEKVIDIVLADRLGPPAPAVASSGYAEWLGDWWSPATGMVYSLVDQKGGLELRTAKALLGGPLRSRGDRCLFEPAGVLGEVELMLEAPDRVQIRFGATRADYHRLKPTSADAQAFAEAALGTYTCGDAAITAEIVMRDGELVIRTSDGHGELIAPLVALSDQVAFARPGGLLAPFRYTITLDLEARRANSFRLFTPRTRNLVFTRR